MTDKYVRLEEQLKASCSVTPEQLAAAREHAETQGSGLLEAIAALNILGYADLGRCLSDLHRLPYRPLMQHKPFSDQARSVLSPRAAAAWGVFPMAHDLRQNVLTLAVDEPAKMSKVDRVRRLLMQPYDLAFTMASKPEIETAFQVHFGILLSSAGREKLKMTGIDKIRRRPRPLNLFRRDRQEEGLAYADMSRALVMMTASLAASRCGGNPERLQKLQRRVRYCVLLSSRLDLSSVQTDGLVLAAWLSPLEDRKDLAQRLPARYGVAEILFPDGTSPADPRTEAQILRLIECHEDFQEHDTAGARDIAQVRRHLRNAWAFSRNQQEMIETFLQILVDEEFLAELDRKSSSVLVVDSTGMAQTDVMPTLAAEGYNVDVVRSEAAAWDVISASRPDLIVSELDLEQEQGIGFCAKVKRAADAAPIGFIVVAKLEEQDRALECLRSGADDFLTRPLAPEVLAFKVQKFLSSPSRKEQSAGITGSLGDMNLVDMIQILSAGGRSVEIAVTHAGRQGLVVMESGEIVHARCGDKTGENALYEILHWDAGDFTTRAASAPSERTIRGSVISLLMESARVADESRPDASERETSG